MGFKRAQWHSGLTYRQNCHTCGIEVVYMDDKLDFRPWFADGFVYCPRCKTPLRHNERFAINGPNSAPASGWSDAASTTTGKRFCTQCGRQARPDDRFCCGCGTKLID